MARTLTLHDKLLEFIDHAPHDSVEEPLFKLCDAIGKDARFARFDHQKVIDTVSGMIGHPIRDITNSVEVAHRMLEGKSATAQDTFVSKLLKSDEDLVAGERKHAARAYEGGVAKRKGSEWINGSSVTTAEESTFSKQWSALSHDSQANVAFWMACAALGLLGIYNSTPKMTTTDDQGVKHPEMSHVLVTLIQGCLVAGCARMGVKAFQAGR